MNASPRKRYTILPANGNDESVARLLRDLHARVFADTAPQIEPAIGWWWIAWLRDEAAAFAGLHREGDDPCTGFLHRAGVIAHHRGHGIQRRLIRIREAMARSLGMKFILTDTTDNIESSNNLIRCGYRLYQPESPWAFSNSLYWTKAL